jgi:hypothetical protein
MAQYSFEWANRVVNQVFEAYPRATDIVMTTLHLSTIMVIRYARNDQNLWRAFKSIVKRVDRFAEPDAGEIFSQEIYTNVKLIVVGAWKIACLRSGFRLTDDLRQIKL